MAEYMEMLGKMARQASRELSKLTMGEKNAGILSAAKALREGYSYILRENQKDVEQARQTKMKATLVDRLLLDKGRIDDMAEGLEQIASLEDPIGEVLSMKTRPNGLRIGVKKVPLGVVGIIYESRPNVTSDAFGLCFKTGNAVVLRGGSDAICSNIAIVTVIKAGLQKAGLNEDAVLLVEDVSREVAADMMCMRDYIDVLIPRGGKGLIQTVVKNSTISVIETGTGNCHIYVDAHCDYEMAIAIIENAKTQRMGVCNACESLVVHQQCMKEFLPLLVDVLDAKGVEIRGDEKATSADGRICSATEEDWGMEYLDAILSVKIVESIEEGIAHINKYNTGHSEAIITNDYKRALQFQDEIDAAAVYVNASTRFTDGCEFGFGTEIGISTQKLHARGPMGLEALTTTKYIIFGNGQVR